MRACVFPGLLAPAAVISAAALAQTAAAQVPYCTPPSPPLPHFVPGYVLYGGPVGEFHPVRPGPPFVAAGPPAAAAYFAKNPNCWYDRYLSTPPPRGWHLGEWYVRSGYDRLGLYSAYNAYSNHGYYGGYSSFCP